MMFSSIENDLFMAINDLINKNGVKLFYTGGMGEFDDMFSATVKKTKIRHHNDVKLILVKPYFSNEINTNKEFYEQYYDDVIIPCELLETHPKAAIKKRNQWMIDESDYVIGGVYKDYGGAYDAIRYAAKQGKLYINIKK